MKQTDVVKKTSDPQYFQIEESHGSINAADKKQIEKGHIDALRSAHDKKKLIKGVLTLIGGVLIFLTLGSLYTFGNMLPYFASYQAVKNGNETDGGYLEYLQKCSYIFSCSYSAQALMAPIGGKLGKKYDFRWMIAIGSFMQSVLGVTATYFVCSNYLLTYITYGVLVGLGSGLIYPNVLVMVMAWFPAYKGLVNGIVLCGYGMSALIFNEVQTHLINPHNAEQHATNGFEHEPDIINNFQPVFLYLGATYFCMQVVGVLLMSTPPVPQSPTPAEISSVDKTDKKTPLVAAQATDYDLNEAVKTVHFWHLYFNFLVNGMIIVFVSTQWKIYSNYIGIKDDAVLTSIGSSSSIFNGFGRIVFGLIFDKTQSFRLTLGTNNLFLAIFLFTWPFTFGNVMPFIWACFLFFLFSANFSIFPSITSKVFGAKNVGTNYGFLFTSQIFSAFIGIYAVNALNLVLPDWKSMCFIMASFQFIGCILSFAFPIRPLRKSNSTDNKLSAV